MAGSQIVTTVLVGLPLLLVCTLLLKEVIVLRKWRRSIGKQVLGTSLAEDWGVLTPEQDPLEAENGTGKADKRETREGVALGQEELSLAPTLPTMQTSTNPSKINQLLEILITEICTGLSIPDFFGRADLPSFFIIYAHNNDKFGKADDRTVHSIIKYFKEIGSRTRSDRRPVLASEPGNSAARHNILANQLCLLPKHVAVNHVDKVILCHSEVLHNYCIDPVAKEYVEEIKKVGRREMAKYELGGPSPKSPNPEHIRRIQDAIRTVITEHRKTEHFHHVMTEVGLVALRVSHDNDPLAIIPVDLHSTDTILNDFSFLDPLQHYETLGPPMAVQFDDSERTHRLFFKLIKRLYHEVPIFVDFLEEAYNNGVKNFHSTSKLTITEFTERLRTEIYQELVSSRKVRDKDRAWPRHLEPEGGEQIYDTPLTAWKTVGPVMIPPPQIPSDLLVPPTGQQRDLIKTLHFDGMGTRVEHIPDPYAGTVDWLFDHPLYLRWRDQDGGMLGIRGGPGSGKSTALKAILALDQVNEGQTHLQLSYFFHGRGTTLQKTRLGMYQTLLFQLLNKIPSAGEDFWPWAESMLKGGPSVLWFTGIVRELFIGALLLAGRSVRIRIFIDALDEAVSKDTSPEGADEEARAVIADLRRINRIKRGVSKGLSICFACRYYPVIVVDNGLEIKLEEHNTKSIGLYITTALTGDPVSQDYVGREEFNYLVKAIKERSSGFFLWTHLVVQSVREGMAHGDSFHTLMQRIEAVPLDLEHLYTSMFAKLTLEYPKQKSIMLALIQWIRFARRPMTLGELRYAMGSDESLMSSWGKRIIPGRPQPLVDDDISMLRMVEKFTCGLTKVVENTARNGHETAVVHIIHQTVFEYLSRPDTLSELVDFDTPEGGNWVGRSNDRLGRACHRLLRCIDAERDRPSQKKLEDLPFYDYAIEFWFVHAAVASINGVSQGYIMEALGPSAGRKGELLLIRWATSYGRERLRSRSLGPLPPLSEIAEAFNIREVLDASFLLTPPPDKGA
ncbi:MAG: hypothetical protein Q9165_007041 [Trypethelium subeluteriae]